jgi:hypothetical protein
MDFLANNYNSYANVDDGSCIYIVNGCVDPNALNFDPNANFDNGSCIDIILGCMDANYMEFNINANVDNGTCNTSWELGYTTVESLNFNLYDEISAIEYQIDSVIANQCAITVQFQEGWNMFGYTASTPDDIGEVMKDFDDYIEILKDNNGDQYWPEFNYNSIGDFTPGSGYQIKVNSPFSLVFGNTDVENDETSNIFGCTDDNFINFNSNANIDDNSCSDSWDEAYSNVLDLQNILLNQLDSLNSQINLSNQNFQCDTINIQFQEGWNMFGYCSNQIIDISQVLGENDNYIDIMKDNNGDQYWPEFNYNSIGNFTPGSGYQIKVNNSFSISF